jgi:hypothetical protein
LNIKPDHSSDIEGDLVEQGIPKLSYFDQSDAHDKNVKGKHTNQIFRYLSCHTLIHLMLMIKMSKENIQIKYFI